MFLCFVLNLVFAFCSLDSLGSLDSLPMASSLRQEVQKDIEDLLELILEKYAQDIEEEELENFILSKKEELLELYSRKIKINSCGKKELEELFFLNTWEIDAILNYLASYGSIISLGELDMMANISKEKLEFLKYFISLEVDSDKSWQNILKRSKNEVIINYKRKLYTQDEAFIGSPNAYAIKYKLSLGDKISFGFAAEKDAGEKAFLDSYSAFIDIKNTGIIKDWIIGCYKLNIGYGLNFGSSLFSSSSANGITSRGSGIKTFASTAEDGYFSGSALSLNLSTNLDLGLFYSHKKMDATLEGNSLDGKTIKSFAKGGYHRTENELKKKKNIESDVFGGFLEYSFRRTMLGVCLSFSGFDKDLDLNHRLYNRYALPKSRFADLYTNLGLYHQVLLKPFHIFGEIASNLYGIAVFEGIECKLHSKLSAEANLRYYSKSFHSFYSGGYSFGSNINNEFGSRFALNFEPFRNFRLSASGDFINRFWYSYPQKFPSTDIKYNILASYFGKRFSLDLYFKHISGISKNSIRLDFRHKAEYGFRLRANLELINFRTSYLLFADLGYKFSRANLEIIGRYALFSAEEYSYRFFAYESDLLYNASFPMYYGTGQRFYVFIRYKAFRFLTLEFKYAHSLYDHKPQEDFYKPEVKFQMRFTL